MTVIKSNHDAPLGLPRGPMIQPGRSVRVENWPVMKDSAIVRAWLAAGVIEVEVGKVVPAKAERVPVAVPVATKREKRAE